MLDLGDQPRHVALREGGELLVVLARVDQHARGLGADHVTQHALCERQVLVQQLRRLGAERPLADRRPEVAQIGDVGAQLVLARGFGERAHDEAAFLLRRQELLQPVAQLCAAVLVLDLLRDADVRIVRQVDEQPPGERDLRREARALRADRVLDHLHLHGLPFGQDFFYRLARLAVFPDVGHVQERGALEADVDEGRLHPRQHARHAAHVDVAHQATAARALDEQFLDHAGGNDGNARLARRDVNENFFGHLQRRCASFSSSSAVSYSGRPITPE